MDTTMDSITGDKRIEYQALRNELQQADQACLIMTGFIFAALGGLYSIGSGVEEVLWISSFLCFIGLLYYTEKRFIIRKIASYLSENMSGEDSGFGWEKYVSNLRKEKSLRPIMLLRPYNAEVIICILGSLSPLAHPEFIKGGQYFTISKITWLVITVIVIILSIINVIKYRRMK